MHLTHRIAGLHIEDTNPATFATDGKAPTIGRKGHSRPVRLKAWEYVRDLPCRNGPNPRDPVICKGRQPLTVRREGQLPYFSCAGQLVSFCPCPNVPQFDDAAVASRRQQLAIG